MREISDKVDHSMALGNGLTVEDELVTGWRVNAAGCLGGWGLFLVSVTACTCSCPLLSPDTGMAFFGFDAVFMCSRRDRTVGCGAFARVARRRATVAFFSASCWTLLLWLLVILRSTVRSGCAGYVSELALSTALGSCHQLTAAAVAFFPATLLNFGIGSAPFFRPLGDILEPLLRSESF